jgi:hypothetical protein
MKNSSTDSNSMGKIGKKFKTLLKQETAPKSDPMHKSSSLKLKKIKKSKTKANSIKTVSNLSLDRKPRSVLMKTNCKRKILFFLFTLKRLLTASKAAKSKADNLTFGEVWLTANHSKETSLVRS